MGCDIQRDKNGQMTRIVCSRSPRAPNCRWCATVSTKLCDFPVNGRTCDAPICYKHAKSIRYEVDYCPDHQQVKA
jgi:hypothetical protein